MTTRHDMRTQTMTTTTRRECENQDKDEEDADHNANKNANDHVDHADKFYLPNCQETHYIEGAGGEEGQGWIRKL